MTENDFAKSKNYNILIILQLAKLTSVRDSETQNLT